MKKLLGLDTVGNKGLLFTVAAAAFYVLALLWFLPLQHVAIDLPLQSALESAWDVAAGFVNNTKGHPLLESSSMLMAAVVMVAVVRSLNVGDAILGYLLAGAAVGPHALNLVKDVANVQHMAELGVVFLLFNIGLELSLERLINMAKYVFGMGAAQFFLSAGLIAVMAVALGGFTVPEGAVIGAGLALSSTAVAMPTMQNRNEAGTRYGRGTFSVLLFQDLAVVLVIITVQ